MIVEEVGWQYGFGRWRGLVGRGQQCGFFTEEGDVTGQGEQSRPNLMWLRRATAEAKKEGDIKG